MLVELLQGFVGGHSPARNLFAAVHGIVASCKSSCQDYLIPDVGSQWKVGFGDSLARRLELLRSQPTWMQLMAFSNRQAL